jgi:predicted transcriptional regulator of viral defense system
VVSSLVRQRKQGQFRKIMGILKCRKVLFTGTCQPCNIPTMGQSKPIPKGRAQLSQVLQSAGELISVDAVTSALQIDRRTSTKLLARWGTQGWVKRLRRGLYAPVPIASLGQVQVLEDPWLIVPSLFGPAYIGGWTAAEHWGLTEQIFRSVCVLTTRPVRGKEKNVQGIDFSVKQISRRAMFETRTLWRGKIRVEVSSPSKTIIDMLDDPAIGGGIRHVSDCLNQYLSTKNGTPDELISVAARLDNGAVFKRLGFLAERRGGPEKLIADCRKRLTAGNAKLDPAVPCRKLLKRWRLWLPRSWVETKAP